MTITKIDSSKLTITKTTSPKDVVPNEKLVFGKTFTDHMLKIEWHANAGWENPEIVPYGPLVLDPSCCVFHYAFELFEGLKAYKGPDGKVRMYRPDKNMARMNKSANRIVLPEFDGEELIKCISELIALDERFIPSEPNHSLYIRPTLIGTTAGVGVGAPSDALLYVILSPAGPYYPTGLKAVTLEATDYAVRAWPGGNGDAKLGANYAPCTRPQLEAASRGFQQNLWLFGEQKYVTEVGAMNIFFAFKDPKTGKKELVTAPLDGTILEGVTRDSILELTRERLDPSEWDINERPLSMFEVAERSKNGELLEAFGCGTAVFVSPVKSIGFQGELVNVPLLKGKEYGELTNTIAQWIGRIHRGEEEYKNWTRVIC